MWRCLALLIFMPSLAFAEPFRVIDGDTLARGNERIRLYGIDAPELGQTCRKPSGEEWLCGAAAKMALEVLIGIGNEVHCEIWARDRYGRSVATCGTEQRPDLGADMVRHGWALAYRRYSQDYVGDEAVARVARDGIWASHFERPWDWRARGG